ncbi:hypothetical protein OIU92_22105 [Escherichia coli]|nr:hypothetical protein [Escherichia coli]
MNQALLNSRYLAYLNEKAAVLQSVEECDLDTLDTEELLARFMEKLSPLHEQARRLGIDVSVHHPEDLNILNCTLKQKLADIRKINTQRLHAEKRCQTVLATWPSPYNPEQLVRWMESPLRPALQQYYQDYPRRGVKCYFVHFLGADIRKGCSKCVLLHRMILIISAFLPCLIVSSQLWLTQGNPLASGRDVNLIKSISGCRNR